MNLIDLLGQRKNKEKPRFIDEDLTPEEINKKIGMMDWDEAKEYVKRLSHNKSGEVLVYSFGEFFKYMRKMDKQCIKEHGKTAWDYYDLEHPC